MGGQQQLAFWLKTLAPGAALALFYTAIALLLQPFIDLPFVDDWTRGWSVEHLLQTGQLRVPDWTSHYPFVQILWGAIFCLPYGFSFAALRVSTVVLAWLGALAFYATLRELQCSWQESLIATLLLLLNPVFFVLTFSFMTDVPFVSLANIAFFFLVRGIVRQRTAALWIGSLFGICAFFSRQLALAIPAACLAYLCLTRYFRQRPFLLPPLLSLLLLLFIPLWIGRTFGFTGAYLDKLNAIRFWLLVPPAGYTVHVLSLLLHTGLALSPIALPLVGYVRRRLLLGGVILVLCLWEGAIYTSTARLSLPLGNLKEQGMWTLAELGGALPLLRGTHPALFLPSWFNYFLIPLSLVSVAVLIVRVIEMLHRDRERPEFVFVLYALFQIGCITALWFFYDRYYVVLFPPLIVVLISQRLPWKRGAIAGIVLLLLCSLSGTWDNLQITKATYAALTWLREQQIPLAEIDAGYVLNGWNLYGHPQNLASGATPERDVPFVTSQEEKPFVIAVSPLPGYHVLREIGWAPSFWAATDKIYVLEKE